MAALLLILFIFAISCASVKPEYELPDPIARPACDKLIEDFVDKYTECKQEWCEDTLGEVDAIVFCLYSRELSCSLELEQVRDLFKKAR